MSLTLDEGSRPGGFAVGQRYLVSFAFTSTKTRLNLEAPGFKRRSNLVECMDGSRSWFRGVSQHKAGYEMDQDQNLIDYSLH
jgi:hypothetical protein